MIGYVSGDGSVCLCESVGSSHGDGPQLAAKTVNQRWRRRCWKRKRKFKEIFNIISFRLTYSYCKRTSGNHHLDRMLKFPLVGVCQHCVHRYWSARQIRYLIPETLSILMIKCFCDRKQTLIVCNFWWRNSSYNIHTIT